MSHRSYNPHDRSLPRPPYGNVPDKPDDDMPHACVGITCHIGSVTGLGCPSLPANDLGWTGCKLRASKPDPDLPKPPAGAYA